MAPESEKNAWFGVESREHSLMQSTPVGTEEQVEKSLRSLNKNDLRMSRGLGDILIEKGEGETNRDFWKIIELFLLAVHNESHGMFPILHHYN